mmetsp:Transcript_84340/g.149087  ORF Transcript_84340/g.149087 Transcript_84340/m.149087 type:complete len:264 (-) Transcript_84340:10-801(-)|eukprot:CAMPEP_0197635826 /NCGR_PEP_ID=MMETSP1338-20131121/11529_1 /TAXON_ID=43686 ORGANISM="Pelagodinium beii, Strain RCC1491" /NCGR_SAMPLE_ID=MMETSP1338 /ASSEMBLY_ACC=CAM_ASM_000754 /LENGTH=263 /DNA_ID=CAMNT_0043207951 /DNA_START=113 /DNA_END=904 /DNA_ORIENTATION=+
MSVSAFVATSQPLHAVPQRRIAPAGAWTSRCGPAIATFGLLDRKLWAIIPAAVLGGRRRRALRSQRQARKIVVEVASSAPLSLESGTVESMDEFMAEKATEVSLQNVQQVEDVSGSGEKRCYLEPADFGPLRTQMRLTVKVDLPKSGECDVNITKMESGALDKQSDKAKKFDKLFANVNTKNSLSWKMGDKALEVLYTTTAQSTTSLPFWFPLPDGMVKSLIEGQIRRMISSGQDKVMENIQQKYTDWQTARLAPTAEGKELQ